MALFGDPSHNVHMHAGVRAALASPNTPKHLKKHLAKRLGKIKIKPENKGKLHAAAGVAPGKKIPLAKEQSLKANGTPAQKKEANFAINARSWAKNPLRRS